MREYVGRVAGLVEQHNASTSVFLATDDPVRREGVERHTGLSMAHVKTTGKRKGISRPLHCSSKARD